MSRIGDAEELRISSCREDGSLRRWTPIWVVRVNEDVFVRSAFGSAGAWYRNVMRNKRARVLVGDVERDVNLEPVTDDAVNAAVGAAYRRKVPFAAQLTGADGGVHGSRDHGTALPTD